MGLCFAVVYVLGASFVWRVGKERGTFNPRWVLALISAIWALVALSLLLDDACRWLLEGP